MWPLPHRILEYSITPERNPRSRMVPSFPQILPFPLGVAGSHESAFHFCRFASVLEISCKWIPATCSLSSPAFLAQRGVSGFSCSVAVDQYLPAFSRLNNIPLWICSLWFPTQWSRSACAVSAFWLLRVVPL